MHNKLMHRQNFWHFSENIFKLIFLFENYWILIQILLNHISPHVQWTKIHHWFRNWLGADQAKSYYLNQWWPTLLTHICVTRHQGHNPWSTQRCAWPYESGSSCSRQLRKPVTYVDVASQIFQPILQTDTTHTVVVTSPGLRQYRSY